MWNRTQDGDVEYAIHDVYFTREDRPVSWTEHARSPRLQSLVALRQWISAHLAAHDEGVVCGDLGYEHRNHDFELWLTCLDEPPLEYASLEGR